MSILLLAAASLIVSAWALAKNTHPLRPAEQIIALKEAQHRQAPNKQGDLRVLARGEKAFLGHLELKPGAAIPKHRDPTEEYIYILKGTGHITINGKTSPIGPGQTVYMPAGAEVSFKNGEQTLVGLQVFAGPESADKYLKWPIAAQK